MLFEFIATLATGAGLAGIVFAINKLLGGRLPKWMMPAAAGLGMLFYAVWSEYTWFDRNERGMGSDMIVASTSERAEMLRPWTYLFPVTTRFIGVDRDAVWNDDIVATDVYLVARWQDIVAVPVAFDCANSARADFVDQQTVQNGQDFSDVNWTPLEKDDKVLRAACDGLR